MPNGNSLPGANAPVALIYQPLVCATNVKLTPHTRGLAFREPGIGPSAIVGWSVSTFPYPTCPRCRKLAPLHRPSPALQWTVHPKPVPGRVHSNSTTSSCVCPLSSAEMRPVSSCSKPCLYHRLYTSPCKLWRDTHLWRPQKLHLRSMRCRVRWISMNSLETGQFYAALLISETHHVLIIDFQKNPTIVRNLHHRSHTRFWTQRKCNCYSTRSSSEHHSGQYSYRNRSVHCVSSNSIESYV